MKQRKKLKKKKGRKKYKNWRRNQQNEIRTITFSFPLKYLAHSNAHKHTIKGRQQRSIYACVWPGKKNAMEWQNTKA